MSMQGLMKMLQLFVIFITLILSFLLVIYKEPTTSASDRWTFPTLMGASILTHPLLATQNSFSPFSKHYTIYVITPPVQATALLLQHRYIISNKYLAQSLHFTCKPIVSCFNISPFFFFFFLF